MNGLQLVYSLKFLVFRKTMPTIINEPATELYGISVECTTYIVPQYRCAAGTGVGYANGLIDGKSVCLYLHKIDSLIPSIA